MTGRDFRGIRESAHLSIRKAAEKLKVSPSTIQRWQEDDAEIPYDAAVRITELAGGLAPIMDTCHALGRLFGTLEKAFNQEMPYALLMQAEEMPATSLGLLLRQLRVEDPDRYRQFEPEIERLMRQIPNFPSYLGPAQHAEFMRGFYGRRAEPRRDVPHVRFGGYGSPSIPWGSDIDQLEAEAILKANQKKLALGAGLPNYARPEASS